MSLDPKQHTAVSFETIEVSYMDQNSSTSATYVQEIELPKQQGQPHAPIGKPHDSRRLDYLGNSEEEGSGTSEDDTSLDNEHDIRGGLVDLGALGKLF